jgi:FKBP-type peptidyl-prolyl cis-trans isomerase
MKYWASASSAGSRVLATIVVVTTLQSSMTTCSCDNFLMAQALAPSSVPATNPQTNFARRNVLSKFMSVPVAFLAAEHAQAIQVADPPLPQFLSSVVLDEPGVSAGVQLYDVKIGINTYTAVKSVQSEGIAAKSGVQEGMILLGKDKTAAQTVNRIKNGPYPIVLQFYDLAEGSPARTSLEALQLTMKRGEAELARKDPPLQSKGTGLIVKTVRKGDCQGGTAKRGDTLVMNYEARVASPGGPIYDSTSLRGKSVEFTLGKNEAIKGVDIGLNGMCQGEVRELDIPNLLGYGQFGSDYFDVPGDVRLWWRVELVKLTKEAKTSVL